MTEHKFDGLSISLLYEKGALVRGVTRGDGTTGEDVTPNVQNDPVDSAVRSIRRMLKKAGACRRRFEVRGEAIMTRKAFEAMNEQQDASGRQNFRESAECGGGRGARARSEDHASRQLDFFAYYMLVDGRAPKKRLSEVLETLSTCCISRRATTGSCAIRSKRSRSTSRQLGHEARKAGVRNRRNRGEGG